VFGRRFVDAVSAAVDAAAVVAAVDPTPVPAAVEMLLPLAGRLPAEPCETGILNWIKAETSLITAGSLCPRSKAVGFILALRRKGRHDHAMDATDRNDRFLWSPWRKNLFDSYD
jgi:hypothetical protein